MERIGFKVDEEEREERRKRVCLILLPALFFWGLEHCDKGKTAEQRPTVGRVFVLHATDSYVSHSTEP